MAHEKLIELTAQTFEQEVLHSDIPVMVDFWAPWCGPCRMVVPIMEQLADEYDGKAKICALNVDEAGDIASSYRVMSVPTLIFFRDGEQVKREAGPKTKEELSEIINSL